MRRPWNTSGRLRAKPVGKRSGSRLRDGAAGETGFRTDPHVSADRKLHIFADPKLHTFQLRVYG